MEELSADERAKLGADLIGQSPPGEVNDVINAIRAIIADDDALMPHASKALRAYNLDNLTVVEHAASESTRKHTSVLSESALLPGSEEERYIDSTGKQSFKFDHFNMAASDHEPYTLPEDEEAFRAELAKSLGAYTKNHFSTGVSSVNCSQHPLLPPEPETPEPEQPPASATVASTDAVEEEEPVNEKAEPVNVENEKAVSTDHTKTPEGGEPVTDVISEQVGAGEAEPAPSPAGNSGDEPAEVAEEEVDAPGGLEKLDEDLKEAKEEEQVDETTKAGPEDAPKEDSPKDLTADTVRETESEEPKGDDQHKPIIEEVAADSTISDQPKKEPRKQERLENPIYTLEVVGNRYKTDAYWTGRWRTRWIVDKAEGKVSGKIQVDVHYFEQGNVQLATVHETAFDYPSESSGHSAASDIVTTISKIEAAYQLELQDVYGDLGEKAFKALRRALPVTRQKVDWDKVGGYSLSNDISKARS